MERLTKALLRQTKALQQRKTRTETQYFSVEGSKGIKELLKANSPFQCRYIVTANDVFPELYHGIRIYETTRKEMEQMSSMQSPPDAIAVFEQIHFPPPDKTSPPPNTIICLDKIQDPGNLGSIIRTAAWFGIRHIVCSKDTVSLYNPKVVRSTMGALAQVEVSYTELAPWLKKCKNDYLICVLDTSGEDLWACQDLNTHPTIFVLGNEGQGISDDVAKLSHRTLTIPSHSTTPVESLNVASAAAITIAFRTHLQKPHHNSL